VLDCAEQIHRDGAHQARESVSLIKFHVAGVLQRVLDKALQVHGALGMTDDTPLAYWYRHERGARIYDGPDEVHKSVVARRILRGYGVKVE
jgi:acyl-CoA dehydrogenase